MMLRASSDATDLDVDLRAVNGDDSVGGDDAVGPTADAAGPEHGPKLVSFAEAAARWAGDGADATLALARDDLRSAVGDAGVIDAAMTVAVFRGLNLTADASGIPFDDDYLERSRGMIDDLDLGRFATSANTPTYRPSE